MVVQEINMSVGAFLKRARPEIVEMTSYSSARSLESADKQVLFLDANECQFEAYIGGENLSKYPLQQPVEAVSALSDLYSVPKQNLVVTRGADEAIDSLIRVFCRAENDNIIINTPTFPMYAHSAAIQGIQVREAKLTEDFLVNPSALSELADENTKIIFLCSPNNPTGTVIDKSVIIELCKTFSNSALVVVDETYIEYAGVNSMVPYVKEYENLAILRSLSKAYAAAGLRCGAAMI